jgi:hypothetical protein
MMKYEEVFKIVKELSFDTDKVILKTKSCEVFIKRPSKLSKRFESYDVEKNFQIWLREDERVFKPNHLRCMIDLNLRVRSRPDLKKELLLLFDKIFYKKDFEKELAKLQKEKFEHYLNSLDVICNLYQLFLIEQEYGYNRESKFDPANLFLHGWIREFLDSPKEIDNMCMSVCSGQPPIAKYVTRENKKSKKYENNLHALWYLEEVQ